MKQTLFPLTPSQIEGPFYPVTYREDENNNLTQIKGCAEKAQGEIIYILGKVRTSIGSPISGALIEIWQADHNSCYNHPRNTRPLDPCFKYWGKTVTDSEGNYQFKTIMPAAYNDEGDWRTPHIHFKVYRQRGLLSLITQLYFAEQALNDQDKHLNGLRLEERKLLVAHFRKASANLEASAKVCEFIITLPL